MILYQRGDGMNKSLIFFVIFNMLVIIASLVVGVLSYNRGKRYFAQDVVYIAPRLNESHLHFSVAEVEALNRAFRDETIVVESRDRLPVRTSMEAAVAVVIYTDALYFAVHSLNFMEGGHWHSGVGGNSIVINQALAWRLFGTTENIVGVPVWIGERIHVVTGVVWQHGETRYMAWMPMGTDIASYSITTLYIHSHYPNPLIAYLARDVARLRPNDYSIVDINRFVESMNIRYRILLYLLWTCMLIFLLRFIWRQVEDNGWKALKSVKGLALPCVGVILCVYVLWGVNNILMWLPNLSNPHTSVLTSITSIGVLPPEGYLPYGLMRLARLSRYVNYASIAGLVGLVNLLFCQGFINSGE